MTDDTQQLQRTHQLLSELGPALTSSLDFREVARRVLGMAMEVARSRAAVLFEFKDKPLMLASLASVAAFAASRRLTVSSAVEHLSLLT